MEPGKVPARSADRVSPTGRAGAGGVGIPAPQSCGDAEQNPGLRRWRGRSPRCRRLMPSLGGFSVLEPPDTWSGIVTSHGGEESHRKPTEVRLAPPADIRTKDRLTAARRDIMILGHGRTGGSGVSFFEPRPRPVENRAPPDHGRNASTAAQAGCPCSPWDPEDTLMTSPRPSPMMLPQDLLLCGDTGHRWASCVKLL